MFFYITYKDNEISGYVQSETRRQIPNAVEVSEEEFAEFGGVVRSPEPVVNPWDNDVKLLQAQIQAQTDRSEFIEDCIAEMATVLYNDA